MILYDGTAVTASEAQVVNRERLRRLLQQINIDSVTGPDALKHEVIGNVSRRIGWISSMITILGIRC